MDTNPSSIRWKQINTPHFKIIFPESYADQAMQTANFMEHLYEPVSASLNSPPKKLKLILQNQNVEGNGFVTLAPRRSEFYTTAPQNHQLVGNNEWLHLLGIHEFRHVVQNQRSLVGTTKGVYYIMGELATSGLSHLAVPNWLWEGDAVCMETALTTSGRGRIPGFSLLMRANTLEFGSFNYQTQYLGSFKRLMPDHYTLGYYLTSHMRREYGADAIDRLTTRAWKGSLIPFRFSHSVKKITGENIKNYYKTVAMDLQQSWEEQAAQRSTTENELLTPRSGKTSTNYLYPQKASSGEIIAVKSGISDVIQLVSLSPNGTEKKLYTMGMVNDNALISVGGDRVAWTEYRYDPRWPSRNYSVIKVFDLSTKKANTITHKSRYNAAALSPDASKIIAVSTDETGIRKLIMLHAATGEEIKTFENPDNLYLATPSFDGAGQSIVAVALKEGRRQIMQIDVSTSETKWLHDGEGANIARPRLYGKKLFFNADYSGVEAVYMKNLQNGRVYLAGAGKYAAANPGYDEAQNMLYFNEYNKYGNDIVRRPINDLALLEDVPMVKEDYYSLLTQQEGNTDLTTGVPSEAYPMKRYRKLSGIVNVHSWGPLLTSTNGDLMLQVSSRDVLSTTSATVGYKYHESEKAGSFYANVSYQGLYPVIGATYSRAYRSLLLTAFDKNYAFDWEEQGADFQLAVPLNLTRSAFRQNLELNAGVGLKKVKGFNYPNITSPSDTTWNGNLQYLGGGIIYSSYRKQAIRDIYPRLGIMMRYDGMMTLSSGDYTAMLSAVQGTIYLPGAFKHHSVRLTGGYQFQDYTNYVLKSPLRMPRGYGYRVYEELITSGVNYALPIWYPDIHLGPIINFQRIRLNVFSDFAQGYRPNYLAPGAIDTEKTFWSVGAEVNFDINLLRINQLLDLGIRYVYLPKEQIGGFGIIVGDIGF